EGGASVGLYTGAYVREVLAKGVLALLAEYGYGQVDEVVTDEEDIIFSLPKELRAEMKRVGDDGRALGGRRREAEA
ncbi:4-hydroxy-3-methylbut-2-enyl diphosphate reductase, partial [Staphylococcus felis]